MPTLERAGNRKTMTHKSVRTDALDCAYLERGPENRPPVLLVHGFPDDARTWSTVAEALANDGFRTIAPFVRGFGPTRLLPGAARSGEIAALARDVLALADALGLAQFHFIGHDWGARAGYALAVLAPDRLLTLTALAVAYGTNVSSQRIDVHQLRAYWYQWYFATPRGEAALRTERAEFCRDLWRTWSPGWQFDPAEYAATAAAFDNPDFVDIVLHSYRVRWGFARGDRAFAADAARLEQIPPIAVPTVVLMGGDDGATLPHSAAGKEHLFTAGYALHVVPNCGHFLQREQPRAVISAARTALRRDERSARRDGS
jgi:pimeloyl-ACP methyl ester carboxylesterase